MTAQWKKFKGTKDQLDEMRDAEHGWIVRRNDGAESDIFIGSPIGIVNSEISEYLICSQLPHAEMIAKHAMTGQPVYCWDETLERWRFTHNPGWYKEDQYSFSQTKEKRFIEVREYVWRDNNGYPCIGLIENSFGFKKPMDIEKMFDFVKWVDQDWRRIEI